MNNFNSFNAQPKRLEKEVDKFGNLTYDKMGTNLDNLVDDLRHGYRERSFVATADAYKDTFISKACWCRKLRCKYGARTNFICTKNG